MNINLTIDAGQTAGVGGLPLELELLSFNVIIKDKKIVILYEEYTLENGEKENVRVLSYTMVDGVPQKNQKGGLIQAKNPDGTPAFEDVLYQERNNVGQLVFNEDGSPKMIYLEEQDIDEDGDLIFNEDGSPKMIRVKRPKYLTEQFTRWVSAFKPYLWDAPGTLKDGIKEDYGI